MTLINEVAPPGFGHTKGDKEKGVKKGGTAAAFDKARKEGRFKGSKSDMFAIMWSQKKKGGTAAAFDKARKEGRFKGSKSDMFAIMWSQKNKGDKPHYKPGTDKKYKKYQEEETSMRKKRDVTKSKPKAPQFNAAKELVTDAPYMKPALQQREGTSYKSFMADVQSAKDRLKKKVEDRKKKDAQFVDTKTKGVRFYDKKGKGRIVKGRKIYD